MNKYLEDLNCYLPAFAEEMDVRFTEKKVKYGDTWKERPVLPNDRYEHQTQRFINWMLMAYDKWRCGGEEINWVDVANEAMICWVRENEAYNEEITTPRYAPESKV